MKKFDLYDYSVNNYQRVVGEGFLGTRLRDFLWYEPHVNPNAGMPLPIGHLVEEHLTVHSYIERSTKGLLYYRPGYDFLCDPASWILVRTDNSVLPSAATFLCDRHFFIQREYCTNNLIDSEESPICSPKSDLHFYNVQKLSQKGFKAAKFEDVIGVFIQEESDENLLFHSYSGGFTLDRLTRAPPPIREEVQKILGQAMGELHKVRIRYNDPTPINMRYVLGDKIILSPHNCMEFKKRMDVKKLGGIDSPIMGYDDITDDLAVLIYTNDWIKDIDHFLSTYTGPGTQDLKFRQILSDVIRGTIEDLETGDYGDYSPLPCMWFKRGKQKYYDI
jgi:hypothetical protein